MPTIALIFVICTTGVNARCVDIDGGTYTAAALCARAGYPELGHRKDADTMVIAFECSLSRPTAGPERH